MTTSNKNDGKRKHMIHQVTECIKEDMPYWMYVGYMQQWDLDGKDGTIFDEESYLLIKLRIQNNQEVK